MFVMTAMGLTLTFKEIGSVFTKQPQLLALGMVLQYTILPCVGYFISRYWGLEQGLAVGVALVSCMPGGCMMPGTWPLLTIHAHTSVLAAMQAA